MTGQGQRKRKVNPRTKEKLKKAVKEGVEDANTQFTPEISLDVSKLPSRGVPYPDDAFISYRTYVFGEVKKASVSNMGMVQSLRLALAGVNCNFDAQKLTLMDALYIGVLRKISSMNGMEAEIPYFCTACGGLNKRQFTQNDIEFTDLSDEISTLPISAEFGGTKLEFAPTTVKAFLEVESGRYDSVIKDAPEESKMDKVAIYATMVQNMDFKSAYEFIYSMNDPEDIEVLEEIDKLLAHNIKPLEAICSQADKKGDVCGHKNRLRIEGREALFIPFRGREKTARARICLGNAPKSESVSD